MLVEEHIKTLQLLNLSTNQAKIYLTLLPEFSLTTEELVEKTNIPRTKIYSELQQLESQNWIIREEGRPIRYIPTDPNTIFREHIELLEQKMQTTESYLKGKWEERGKFQTHLINVFSGIDFLRRETLNEIGKAEKEIILVLQFSFPGEILDIIHELMQRKKKGITIKVVLDPNLFDTLDESIKDQLKKLILVKIAPTPVRTLIIDQKYALMSFLSHHNGKDHTETVKISYPNFIGLMQNAISISFEKFENVE